MAKYTYLVENGIIYMSLKRNSGEDDCANGSETERKACGEKEGKKKRNLDGDSGSIVFQKETKKKDGPVKKSMVVKKESLSRAMTNVSDQSESSETVLTQTGDILDEYGDCFVKVEVPSTRSKNETVIVKEEILSEDEIPIERDMSDKDVSAENEDSYLKNKILLSEHEKEDGSALDSNGESDMYENNRMHDEENSPVSVEYFDDDGDDDDDFENELESMSEPEKDVDMTVHKGKYRYPKMKCPHCYKSYRHSYLQTHIETVHEKLYHKKCDICEQEFHSYRSYSQHRMIKHKISYKQYVCDQCGYTTPYDATFKRHKNSHIEITNREPSKHICDICGKAFQTSSSLKMHIQLHKNPDAFKCEVCEKTFAQKGNLKAHLAKHDKVDKKAKEQDELRKIYEGGKIKHVKGKPSIYPCDLCSKIFRWRGDLTRHKKTIHFGIKPFSCDVCSKKFTDGFQLKEHKFTHTNGLSFKCAHCYKSYRSEHRRKQHYLNVHAPHKNIKKDKPNMVIMYKASRDEEIASTSLSTNVQMIHVIKVTDNETGSEGEADKLGYGEQKVMKKVDEKLNNQECLNELGDN